MPTPPRKCALCKTPLPENATWFPFCSERCKLKDLGAWATGAYAIPGQPATLNEDLQADDSNENEDEP